MINPNVIHALDAAIHNRAIMLYYKHMQLCPIKHSYMWEQCTPEYKAAWYTIASSDVCSLGEMNHE